jgi:hypothetical protein
MKHEQWEPINIKHNVEVVTPPAESTILNVISKAIPLQALTGPEGSRKLWLPDFKTIGT